MFISIVIVIVITGRKPWSRWARPSATSLTWRRPICTYIYIHMYICMCVYIYIYIYHVLYICVCIMYMFRHVEMPCSRSRTSGAWSSSSSCSCLIPWSWSRRTWEGERYVCVCIYVYVCVYIYIYMHTHTYTHVVYKAPDPPRGLRKRGSLKSVCSLVCACVCVCHYARLLVPLRASPRDQGQVFTNPRVSGFAGFLFHYTLSLRLQRCPHASQKMWCVCVCLCLLVCIECVASLVVASTPASEMTLRQWMRKSSSPQRGLAAGICVSFR